MPGVFVAAVAVFLTLALVAVALVASLPFYWVLGLSWVVPAAAGAAVALLVPSVPMLVKLHRVEFTLRRSRETSSSAATRAAIQGEGRTSERRSGSRRLQDQATSVLGLLARNLGRTPPRTRHAA